MDRWMPFFLLLTFANWQTAHAQDDSLPDQVKSIYFGGGSYYVDPGQQQELYDFLDAIPDIEFCEIEIQSFTDNIGSLRYNQYLSQMRSEMVLQKILERDFPREQITILDFGELNPLYDNATLQGRLHNRRVDVIIKRIIQ
ncbi:MAG: OmpA family protein [Bacteroidota bacterium]